MKRLGSRTTVISVSFNSAAVLSAMLASIPKGVDVIVVDNASTDDSAFLAGQSGARVIRLPKNLGFGAACNEGYNATDSEFVFFVNPDAILAESCIPLLEASADRYPAASAFNPCISDLKGNPYFKRRSVLLPNRDWLPKGWPKSDQEIPVLSGSALFCRKSAFDRIGGFDTRIFLYHEDDDLSLRLRSHAGPLMFIRQALVRHSEGRSSARSATTARIKSFHMGRSRVYAMTKHGIKLAHLRGLFVAITKFIDLLP